jgi:hypothetical protein
LAAKFGTRGKDLSIALFISIIAAYKIMCRITIGHLIRYHIPLASLFRHLAIEPLGSYFNRSLLQWAGNFSPDHPSADNPGL